jgi:hypothetical protein
MPHKIDRDEWRTIGREALALLPRLIGSLLDGKLSRDEASGILPGLERIVAAVKSALED